MDETLEAKKKGGKNLVLVVGTKEASIKITIHEDKKHFKQSNESY